jgi:hypothetical protein
MATPPTGKNFADQGKPKMTADYGARAGMALDRLVPGPHRDKAVARLLGVSVRMAKYLRAGQHWTTDRLSQAGAVIEGFDAFIGSPEQILARIGELERELQAIRETLGGGGEK